MAEVLEWFQCKRCGRRQRWTAEIAGKTVTCSCGGSVYCPEGVKIPQAAGAADTIIEDVESPTAESPEVAGVDLEALTGTRAVYGGPLIGAAAREATKRFAVWSALLLIGVGMLIHVAVLYPNRHTFVVFWVYLGLTVVLTPVALLKFVRAKRVWQRGRKFLVALEQSFGA